MKTKKNLTTLIAVVLVTVVSAVETPKISIQPLDSDKLAVSVLNDKESTFEISVNAENGDLVYYKQSNKPIATYRKIFDLKDLENGGYIMTMKLNDTSLETDFTVTAKQIYLGESAINIDPHFVFDGNNLKLSYLNFNQQKFKLEIYNDDNLVYESKIGRDFPINAGYDLSKIETGNYEAVLSSTNEKFTYSFEK